jgi:hypothetical protein
MDEGSRCMQAVQRIKAFASALMDLLDVVRERHIAP